MHDVERLISVFGMGVQGGSWWILDLGLHTSSGARCQEFIGRIATRGRNLRFPGRARSARILAGQWRSILASP